MVDGFVLDIHLLLVVTVRAPIFETHEDILRLVNNLRRLVESTCVVIGYGRDAVCLTLSSTVILRRQGVDALL